MPALKYRVTPPSRVVRIALTFFTAVVGAFCGGSPTEPSQNPPSVSVVAPPPAPVQPRYAVTDFLTAMSASDGSRGQSQTSAAPSPSGGPTITPTGNNRVVNGGSNLIAVQAASAFQVVYVFIGGVSGNVGGYWQIRLAAATTSTTVTASFARSIPVSSFDFVIGVATATGAVSAYSAAQTQVLAASTGSVQISASWDKASDVDLHVLDPSGEEIYWSHPSSASGGALDLDSNAGCDIDGKNNENIRWTGSAPAGTYTVRLDYWSNCGVSQTAYVVTVNNGSTTSTFTGTFTGSGDQGGAGSGRTITSFSRSGNAQVNSYAPRELQNLVVAPISALKTSVVRRREQGR